MTLNEFFATYAISLRSLASVVGCTPGSLSLIANARRRCSLEVGIAIEKATKGKVTLQDLVEMNRIVSGERSEIRLEKAQQQIEEAL